MKKHVRTVNKQRLSQTVCYGGCGECQTVNAVFIKV